MHIRMIRYQTILFFGTSFILTLFAIYRYIGNGEVSKCVDDLLFAFLSFIVGVYSAFAYIIQILSIK